MIDCRDCSEMIIKIDEDDHDEAYYHCENEGRNICNIHENITEAPDWCKYKPRGING
jgi:hypothetical protein